MTPKIRLLLCVLLLPSVLFAADQAPRWESWVVYWDFAKSRQEVQQLAPVLGDVGLFCDRLDANLHVVPAAPAMADGIAALRAAAPKALVWASVTNDRFDGKRLILKDPAAVHELLAPTKRAGHIAELINAAANADGLEIDYENLRAKDRDAYSAFIKDLGTAVHMRHQRLSVVVQAKTTDRVGDEAKAIDWSAVASAADEVKVMAYHFHHASGPPGPIAPPEWVETLAKFALQSIPREKLTLVLTVDGFDWPFKKSAQSIDFPEAIKLASAQHTALKRDIESDSLHFDYEDSAGLPHEVWFEDAVGLEAKIRTLQALGVSRVAFWRLGAGDPEFWNHLLKTSKQN